MQTHAGPTVDYLHYLHLITLVMLSFHLSVNARRRNGMDYNL